MVLIFQTFAHVLMAFSSLKVVSLWAHHRTKISLKCRLQQYITTKAVVLTLAMRSKLIYFSRDSNECKFLTQPGLGPLGSWGKCCDLEWLNPPSSLFIHLENWCHKSCLHTTCAMRWVWGGEAVSWLGYSTIFFRSKSPVFCFSEWSFQMLKVKDRIIKETNYVCP